MQAQSARRQSLDNQKPEFIQAFSPPCNWSWRVIPAIANIKGETTAINKSEIFEQRRQGALEYKQYLRQIVELTRRAARQEKQSFYPGGIKESRLAGESIQGAGSPQRYRFCA